MLLRVVICDSSKGIPLIDKQWKWPYQSNDSIVGNLLQTFFMVARELGESEDIIQILFEDKTTPPILPRKPNALPLHLQRKSSTTLTKQISLQIKKDEGIITAAFHEKTNNVLQFQKIGAFLEAIHSSFLEGYRGDLLRLKDFFVILSESQDLNQNSQQELEVFRPFLDRLEEKKNAFGFDSVATSEVSTKLPHQTMVQQL